MMMSRRDRVLGLLRASQERDRVLWCRGRGYGRRLRCDLNGLVEGFDILSQYDLEEMFNRSSLREPPLAH